MKRYSRNELSAPDWLDRPFVSAIGLSSRRGQFYPPFFPGPEFNWREVLSGLSECGYVSCLSRHQ